MTARLVVKNNKHSEVLSLWNYINEFPGEEMKSMVSVLATDHRHASSNIGRMLRVGQLKKVEGKLYVTGDRYLSDGHYKKNTDSHVNETSPEVESRKDLRALIQSEKTSKIETELSVLLEQQKVVEEKIKALKQTTDAAVVRSNETVLRYVRGYNGRDGGLKLVVIDELPEFLPVSTLWVVQVPFIKCINDGRSYLKVSKEVIAAIEQKSGLKNLAYFNNYFYIKNAKV